MGNHPRLLVSVRSASEAKAALVGGADVIDVKDPARGPLGRAEEAVLTAVRSVVAGQCTVTAALGELRDFRGDVPAGFDLVKCGPAGLTGAEWSERWLKFRDATGPDRAVIVAYADWKCAGAASFDDIVDFACAQPRPIVLVDTGCKDNTIDGRRASLLDWLPADWLAAAIDRVHAVGGRVALAGSLRLGDIERVRELRPDWIALRGAACFDEDRDLGIDPARVSAIKACLTR